MTHNLVSNPRADILVVDDTPDNIRLLSTMLLEQGYRVRKALNGQMALTAAQIVPPDIILLDINMPEMNGYEVCKKFKENAQTHFIPVIFLSALDDVIDKVQAFQVGGVDFITKPFYFEEVLIRIQTQLKIKKLQSQLQAQNTQLQQALNQIKQHQSPLVEGVNNEINNKDKFIFGNLTRVCEDIQKLLNIISIYQQEYPNPTGVVKQALEEVDLELIIAELKKLVE
jgi:DNA-binding response OmpR family regulator